jgi:minor tail protein Z (GPZ)
MRQPSQTAKGGVMPKPGLAIAFDWSLLLDRLHGLTPPKLDRAVALALVDTAKSATAKAATTIAKRTGLRSAKVKSKIHYDKVKIGDYQTFIRSSRKLIPMIDYGARQTAVGVRAAKPWGKAQVFRSKFIVTMPGGHRGVYYRVGRSRLPIKELMGPGIWHTFKQPDVQAVVVATIKTRLPIAIARRIKAEQRRKG